MKFRVLLMALSSTACSASERGWALRAGSLRTGHRAERGEHLRASKNGPDLSRAEGTEERAAVDQSALGFPPKPSCRQRTGSSAASSIEQRLAGARSAGCPSRAGNRR
jgi:hypothetical protein